MRFWDGDFGFIEFLEFSLFLGLLVKPQLSAWSYPSCNRFDFVAGTLLDHY